MVSLSALCRESRKRLEQAGCEDAARDVRELVCHAYGIKQAELLRDPEREVDPAVVAPLLTRRARQEPLAYLLGEWEFYGVSLRVTPDVLIPRDDTETLVDAVREKVNEKDFYFLDLCTGSGCVGIALASVCENAHGVLLDNARAALAIAQENIAKNGLCDRLETVWGDVREAPHELGGFDVILANPPYITDEEMRALDTSVRAYEPQGALFGGIDGFDFYDAILKNWSSCLKPGGWLAFECGYRQAEELNARMCRAGFIDVEKGKDLQKIERVVLGRRPDRKGTVHNG